MTARRFPNESESYRAAREELLRAELELRGHVERVAAQRRTLPPGGAVPTDYEFEELAHGMARTVKLSELFATGQDTVLVYNFMYGPNAEHPCPLCTSLLDVLNAQVRDVTQRIGFVVVARSPIQRIAEFAGRRGWDRLRLLSSANNTYNVDYLGEDGEGRQMPMANVFVRNDEGVHHFWGSEMLYADGIEGGDMRHVDALWPLWNVFDLTPGGRGDFYPSLVYDES